MSRRQSFPLSLLETLPWWFFLATGVFFWSVFSFILPLFSYDTVLAEVLFSELSDSIGLVFLVLFSLVAIVKFLAAWRRRRLLENQMSLETLRRSTWQDFERIVGEIYRRKGYTILETGGGGADGGIDLKLSKDGEIWLVQCKKWSREQVGVGLVRELLGVVASEKVRGGIFITTSVFTPDAESFARRNPIDLVSGSDLLQLVAQTKKTKLDSGEDGFDISFPAVVQKSMDPICAWCGSAMVRRTATKGARAGKHFWGCIRYPKCRFTRDDS